MVELGDRGLTRYYMSEFKSFDTPVLAEVNRVKYFVPSRSTQRRCMLWVNRVDNGELMRVFDLNRSSFHAGYCQHLHSEGVLEVYVDNEFQDYAFLNAGTTELFDKLLIWLSPILAFFFAKFWVWAKT